MAETADDFNWEDFSRGTTVVADAPYVSIQKKGIFSLNRGARALLGDPEEPLHVRLRFDRTRQVIGIAIADPDAPNAYPVRAQRSHGATWIIAGTAFCKKFGIPIGETRRYRARSISGPILIIDLNSTSEPAESEQGLQNGRSGDK